ncbi:helix-turn-helix transcriptional regulator [Catellatospora tritici]|uniref:helix-turn-helix transcriptional regulator n=1 Tax=Catellatospora tritici TaxID=2851566 RepID=UPI001C2DD242|nr:LuxR family transcriptional regulator [Catellatospora tritici]MBV1855115.1 AAA family ATPase [Catellatospora tritici]
MFLAERDDELRVLESLLADCGQGLGRVAVIRSAIAIGKTALLAEFARRAAETGARVVAAMASRAEQDLPFGVVGQLLYSAGETPTQLPELATTTDGADPRVPPAVLYQLSKVMTDLAASGPLVIMVDDVHYADAASLQCLAYVVRRITATPILIVLTECTSVRYAHPEQYLELVHQPHSRRVQLHPLSLAGVHTVLERHLPGIESAALADSVHAAGAGNPLLVKALLDDLRDTAATEVTPGEAFGRAVMACLYRGEPANLQYAQALAVLDGAGSSSVRAQLSRLPTDAAERAALSLHRTGLADGQGKPHPQATRAILDSMGLCLLRELHDRAAHLLYQEGAPAVDVARQLVDGAVRPPWAVQLLREAGQQALSRGDTDVAVSFLRAAQTADPDSTEARVQADLVRIEWRRDPAAAIRHLDTLTEAACDGLLDPAGSLAQMQYLLWHGRTEQAFDLAERLAAKTSLSTDPQTAGEFRSTCLWLAFVCPGQAHRLNHLIAPDDETAHGRVFGHRTDVSVLLRAIRKGEITADTIAGAEQTLQQHQPGDPIDTTAAALATLTIANQLELALSWVRRLAASAAKCEARTWLALVTALGAEIAFRQGNLLAAEAEAEAALRMLSVNGWGIMIGIPLSTLLFSTTAAGKHDVAATHLSTPVPPAMFDSLPGLLYVRARGYHYLSTRRYRSALNDFRTCQQQATSWELDTPALVPWRTDSARAYLRLGDQRRALHLLHEQLQRLQESRPQHQRVRGGTLRTIAAASDVKKRPALLKEAIQALEQCGDQLELAHAYADLGKALYALGEPHEARGRLRSAQYIARQCNALSLLPTLTPQTETTAVRPTMPERPRPAAEPDPQLKLNSGELSSAERRVAALAAQGHTNREIAGKLFLTVSTVEQHLTRVYRKLNVAGRSDLTPDLTPGL